MVLESEGGMKQKTTVDIWKKIRKDWGGVRPVSQYFEPKTKKTRHTKYKEDLLAEWYEEELDVDDNEGKQ